MKSISIKARISIFLFVLVVVVCAFLWLTLVHPSKQVEFVGTCQKLEAPLWSKQRNDLSKTFFQFKARNIIIQPSRYFIVSEEGVVASTPTMDESPMLLQVMTTPETLEKFSDPFISAGQVILMSSEPIKVSLEPKARLSLWIYETGFPTSLAFVMDNTTEEDRTVIVSAPNQLVQDFSLSTDGEKPIDGELVNWQKDTTILTISLRSGKSMESSDTPWAGLFIILQDQAYASFQQSERLSEGWFNLYDYQGQLTIGNKPPILISGSFLNIDFSDKVRFTLSNNSAIVGGEAKVVGSATTTQLLPSHWDDLPQVGQILTGVVAGLLVLVFGYLLKP